MVCDYKQVVGSREVFRVTAYGRTQSPRQRPRASALGKDDPEILGMWGRERPDASSPQ